MASLIIVPLRWLDQNLEKTVIVIAYSLMAIIICVEVVRRFIFNAQSAWSTSIPIYLFLWVTWLGAAYNVKSRTHLSFMEFRIRMPYGAQFACLVLDALAWISLAGIVIAYTVDQVIMVQNNFAVVPGTDDVPQWLFYAITPFAWGLIVIRVLQNLWRDWKIYRAREPFKHDSSIFND